MKRSFKRKLLSLALTAAMVGTMLPSSIPLAQAKETKSARAVLEDGINDAWTQPADNKVGTDSVCAVEDGWLHLKSDGGNGNSPGTKPAIFLHPGTFDFNADGYFEFTMKSNNTNSAITGSDRFGVYLGFNTDANGMYVGYDNGGWFWQKYTGGDGAWYSGGRTPAPAQNTEVQVRIDWTADHKMTLSLDGSAVFTQEDFSGITSTLGNKIAIKGGSYNSTTVTDVLLKNIHYIGQKEVSKTEVWRHFKSGSGNDNGNNAAILVNTNTGANELEAGEFSFVLKPNTAQANTRFNVGPYITDNSHYMTIGYNATGWFYEYKGAGNSYPTISGLATPPGAGAKMPISIKWNQLNYTVEAGGQSATFSIPQTAYDGLRTGSKLGFRIGSWSDEVTDINFQDVVIKDGSGKVIVDNNQDTWQLQTTGHGEVYEDITINRVTVSGTVKDSSNHAVEGAKVALDSSTTVMTDENGAFSFDGVISGNYTLSITKKGFQTATKSITVEADDLDVGDITLAPKESISFQGDDVLSTADMEAAISNKFPQVIGYTLKGGDNDGKKFYGQTTRLTQLKVNNKLVTPEVTYKKNSDSQATYTMKISEQDITATVTAVLKVKNNTLSFDITKIEAAKGTFLTVEIPNHNLVTVKADQSDATFAGANMSTNTEQSGDTFANVSDMANGKRGYMYAFVSADDLSAGLWSNSENNVTADWQRVTAVTSTNGDVKEVGLSSTYWTYQKSAAHRIENKAYEMPSTKVVITGDENGDDVVDWQDGAVAYRSIMNIPVGSELVPDRVAIRVAMNFNSHAQNPFLMTYDNAQKVYLNTDGLGQSILLKGYGSEGHDSGHLNYADIGKRIGGVEEMKKLLKQGKEIGATFGIHVNASETYPESKYFTEDRLKKDANGNLSYGWNWLDQGVNIDADYDLRNGREQRFVDLWNLLGGKDNDLDFIYVDVWGNGQSGDNGTWASRQLAKEITQTCGWRLGSEWGHANEYDSTFQHWAADLTYGGKASKGINSYVARFIRNHQKDSWVGDYPSYGGAANEPLLGGYDMKDFEGWQGRNDYGGYIQNLFDDDLATKFLQHYKVMKWEIVNPGSSAWVPDKKVTLQDDARQNTITVERKSTNTGSSDYRHRVMKYNERTIMDGEKYLIPWFWDANGQALTDTKLYHWNQGGGSSTWTLPDGWSAVKVYELTETGKVERNIASVSGDQVTINAQANTPYVVYKSTAPDNGISASTLTWSKGAHLVDTGFNSNSLAHWTIQGNDDGNSANIVKSAANNMMLSMGNASNEVSLTQTLTELEPGKGYAAYVGVDNRSDAKAYIEVNVNGKKISNYTQRSIAKNYLQSYAHNTNNATVSGGGSYFQNMYVFFTAPVSGDVTLTLKREAGAGKTYFDDVRVVNNVFGTSETDGSFNPFVTQTKLMQTFEAVPQGIFPFVIGNVENVNDNRTHLSEKHAPYTQAGWYGVKKLDDVITGDWSLKSNGLSGRGKLVYQTIPQNYRFEEGVTYNISFDYEMGSENTYAFAVGDGESTGSNFKTYQLKATDLDNAKPHTFKYRLTGTAGNQAWIGIYSTTQPANTQDAGGSEADFGGYKDFVLDNLMIEKSKAQKAELEQLVNDNSDRHEANYTAASWAAFDKAMKAANDALDDFEATQATVDAAKDALETAIAGLATVGVTLSGQVTIDGTPAPNVEISSDRNTRAGGEVKTTTDENGHYTLPGVEFGTRTITADSNIFATQTKTITVSEANLEETLDFEMARETTTVEGTVTAVGEPLDGARVTIGTKTATTDAKGHYSISGVDTNAYTMRFEMSGYDAVSKDMVATKNGTVTVNAMLPPLTRDEADYENDFGDGKKTWDNLGGNTASTTISMENGETKIIFPGGGHTNVYDTAAPTFKNGKVEMDVRSEQAGIRLGIILRAKDMNNRVYAGVGDSAGEYFAEHWGKGGNSWSNMYSGPSFTAGTKMHLVAEIVDKTVTLWVNGTKVFEETMAGIPMDAGCIGLNTRTDKTVYVDNVKVTSYDLPQGTLQNAAGRVVDKEGNIINGAVVELLDPEGNVVKSTTTDDLGNYKFKNVVLGDYTVRVKNSGYTTTVPVKVVADDDYIVVTKATVGPADKVNLKSLIDYANAQKAHDDYQYVSESVRKAFEDVLKKAGTANDNEFATQDEVNEAYDKLVKSTCLLGYLGASDNLQVLVDVTEGTELDDVYTADTVNAVKSALTAAKEILAKQDATEDEIAAARTALQDAINALERIPVDRSELEKLVEEAKEYDTAKYTPATAKALEAALKGAEEVLAKKYPTQKEVDAAYAALQTAVKGLNLIPDKTKLKETIDKANELDLKAYTSQTVKVFKNALARAKAVMNDPNATEAEVDRAVNALQESMDKLEKAPAKPGNKNDKNDKNDKSDSKGGSKGDGSGNGSDSVSLSSKKNASTGDDTPFTAWAILFMLSFGCVGAALYRRRQQG